MAQTRYKPTKNKLLREYVALMKERSENSSKYDEAFYVMDQYYMANRKFSQGRGDNISQYFEWAEHQSKHHLLEEVKRLEQRSRDLYKEALEARRRLFRSIGYDPYISDQLVLIRSFLAKKSGTIFIKEHDFACDYFLSKYDAKRLKKTLDFLK